MRSALFLGTLFGILVLLGLAGAAAAQDSSLFQRGAVDGRQPLRMDEANLMYQFVEPAKQLAMHDVVTVVVNINSRALSEGDAENRKVAKLDAVLSDWIILDGLRKVFKDPQSGGDPRINAQLNSQYRAEADVETRNTLNFTIAAKVVDELPNGTLLIEARKTVEINGDLWERSLNGIIRREDVTPDNKVLSEDVADLRVVTRETGQVPDGYRRRWLHKIYDRFAPF